MVKRRGELHSGYSTLPATVRVKPLAACIRALIAGSLIATQPAQAELPVVLPGGRWQGALDPRIANGGQDMLIRQIENRALLDWQSFDIGRGNRVRFDQPSSAAVALNRIHDNDPSVINGRLRADGQIYLINRNGIVFGNNAQVDVNTLVASTLNISDEVFEQGLLGAIRNTDLENRAAFVADGDMPADARIEIRAGARLNATQGDGGRIMILAPEILNAGDIRTPDGQTVLAGARDRVYLAQSGDNDLRGLLVEVQTGGDVDNVGSIVAERGNVSILGLAVNQSGLVRATSTVALNGSIRLVAGDNGGVNDPAPLEINSARAADVKGKFFEQRGGTLTLGAGGVTEVVPAGTATATDEQAQPNSFIDLAGRNVTFAARSRVTATGGEVNVVAKATGLQEAFGGEPGVPGAGTVRIEAGAVIDVSGDDRTVVPVSRNVVAVEARGNQLADSPLQRDGAIRNKTLYVDVRKGTPFLNFDLESKAVQRGVNERFSAGGRIRIDATGDVVVENGARIAIRGGKITYTGATVTTSKLVTEDGQVFDISEADPNRRYIGVLGDDLVIDYLKWGRSDRFSSGAGAFEPGYVEGKDAGSLQINTRRLSFNGDLIAGSEAGRLQRLAPSPEQPAVAFRRAFDQRPSGGQLSIDLSSTAGHSGVLIGADEDRRDDPARDTALADDITTVLSADMLERSGIGRVSVDNTGTIRITAPLTLPDNGALSLSAGRIEVGADIRSAGGAVSLTTQKWTQENGVTVADSDVQLRVAPDIDIDVSGRWSNDSPRLNAGVPTAPIVRDGGSIQLNSGGDLLVEAGSVLDVSAGAHLDAAGHLAAGAGGNIGLHSTDNRSGAAKAPTRFSMQGDLRGYAFDEGGALSLTANEVLIADQTGVDRLLGERLPDGARRYVLSGSGPVRTLTDHGSAGLRQIVLIDPDLFESGGFNDFAVAATQRGLTVADGTDMRLRALHHVFDTPALLGFAAANPQLLAATSREAGNGNPLELVPTGTALDAFTQLGHLPDHLRRHAVDLTLASDFKFGAADDLGSADLPLLNIGAGARIVGEAGSNIALASDTSLLVNGSIAAPAGAITLELDTSYERYSAQQKIWLGPQAELTARGAVVLTPNELGFRQGEVRDAGTIALRADYGSIVTSAGSRIDVDATASTLDLPTGAGGVVTPTVIAGRAGSIQLTAAESILLQGELSGRAATPDGLGGELAVTLDPTHRPAESEETAEGGFVPLEQRYPSTARVINVAGFDGALPAADAAIGADLNGQAFIAPDAVVAGGFDSLHLAAYAAGSAIAPDRADSLALIRFPDDIDLNLKRTFTLDAPIVQTADADVRLSAAYVALGSTDTRFRLDGAAPIDGGGTVQADPGPGPGAGHLRIAADLIDLVGDSVTQGFGTDGNRPAVELLSRGDIRLRGTRIKDKTEWTGSLRTGGDLRLRSQQIYPTTLSDFTLRVEAPAGAEGRLDIGGRSGAPGQPLSVGGQLTLDADHIIVRSGAQVRAPIGAIRFTGDYVNGDGEAVGARSITLESGSLLSTSAAGLSIPFGYTQFQKDLVLPVPGEDKTIHFVAAPDAAIEQALPQKSIQLAGNAIDVQSGARFDMSGGGDIRATEFIAGPGGSRDILLADLDIGAGVESNGSFAILPRLASQFAPFDPVESPAAESVQGIKIGQTLILKEGVDGLPAGEYAILPARYALFGGYLVTPVDGTAYHQSGRNLSRTDGTRIVAGHYGQAGAAGVDSRTQGFAIEDGARVRLRAEYAEHALDDLFADAAVRTPRDAGTLTVAAGDALRLAGTLTPTLTGGRGSAVDILGNDIDIIARQGGGTGIELLASDLQGLNADSLLIGATRRLTDDGLVIDARAARIAVAAGVDLDTSELILVADRIDLGAGAARTRLRASGASTQPGDTLIVDGNSALAMVSAKRGATLRRTADAAAAQLNVARGMTLSASGSLMLDANGDVTLAGTLDGDGATLALGGASVSLGETDGRGLNGLVLSNADLARLSGSDLTLRSGSTVDVYGAVANAAGDAHAFGRLAIDAQGLIGRDSATARVAADTLELRNNSGVSLATTVTGNGRLELDGERIVLGSGNFALQGYEHTQLRASGHVLAQDNGALHVTGALTLDTPLLTAAGGAQRSITTDAALRVTGATTATALPATAGLGARLELAGASIDYTGNTVLSSGRVALHADGDIVLNTGARIDVSGRDINFAGTQVGSSGGRIRAESAGGDVRLNAGATLDVSGAAAGGHTGRIELVATQGAVTLAPDAVLRARENGGDHGEFIVDAAQLAASTAGGNALTTLNELLQDDFQARREVRVRSGNLSVQADQVWRAREVKLVADSGTLTVDGGIDASAADGGSIVLAAGDALHVNGRLDAHATAGDGDGGRVELAAIDADGDDLADGVRGDVVNLGADAVIDVRGGAAGNGGSVLVRALAYDGDGNGVQESVAVGALDATLRGAARADVEALQQVSATRITTADMNAWRGLLEQFMDHNTAVLPASWRLLPGLEVASAGDLTLANAWDLYANIGAADDWRFGADNDVPGILTLRAAGSVRFEQSLSDLFAADEFWVAGDVRPYERLGTHEPWRYRIVAGADAASADVLATVNDPNADIVLANGTKVRGGSGDIELAAGGDIVLGDGAAVYTAGLNSGFGAFGALDVNLGELWNFDIVPTTGTEFLLLYLNLGQFPVDGGDIRMQAGGDLRGAAAQVNVTDWQPRAGGNYSAAGVISGSSVDFRNPPAHWAIAFDRFKNGVGTLGGGDITARLGGDVHDVALALPTTGKPDAVDIVTNTDDVLTFTTALPTPRVSGGGDLHLDVAGSLSGGAIQVDRGSADIRVGGDIGGMEAAERPYFAIADTSLRVEARGAVGIDGIFNATALNQHLNTELARSISNLLLSNEYDFDPLFFTYQPDTTAEITAVTGAVTLGRIGAASDESLDLYPPTLKVRSLQGGIAFAGNVQTYAAARGQLELLAEADIRHLAAAGNTGYHALIQSDADPALLPSVTHIVAAPDAEEAIQSPYLKPPVETQGEGASGDITGQRFHAAVPVHSGDNQRNVIVARNGSIVGKSDPGSRWELVLAKQTLLSAGGDIEDMSVRIQHVRDTDISMLNAGGRIRQTLSRDRTSGSFGATDKMFEIAGPGLLQLVAGGDIDLGSSRGVVSIGDTANPALADDGADIQILAGAADAPHYDDFIAAYLEQSALYLNDLNDFLRKRGVNAGGDPVAAFRALSRMEQRELLFAILFKELKASGIEAAGSANKDYSRGFTAVTTLFPGAADRANISTLVSVVKSVDQGDIAMLAPYGDIDAGATFRAIEKNSDGLGIIAARGGNIDIFLDGDLRVNRERVFALQDDLLVWSSNGDIDAGKGAKKVSSVPDPIISFDANGNTVITLPPAVEGSGLNAGGDAYLFAPRGAINAGDAGIRTGGNLTVGAVEVIGSDNIDVGGVSVGVPTTASVPTSVTDAGSLSSSATSLAEDSTSSLGDAADSDAGETLGLLSVELLGFGPDVVERSEQARHSSMEESLKESEQEMRH